MFGAAIYNAVVDRSSHQPLLTIQTRLLHDGKVISSGPPLKLDHGNQTDFTTIVAKGIVHLSSDLAPGKYFLQLIVVDALAKQKQNETTQWIDFEVKP